MKNVPVLRVLTLLGMLMLTPIAKGEEMQNPDIVADLTLNVSVEQAWNLWIENSKLEQWLTAKAHVEPKVGGLYELFWEPEHPNKNSTIGCKITAFVPNKILAYEWKGPIPFADIMNKQPLPTWIVISFEPLTVSSTAIHFRHGGWGEGQRWGQAREWQEKAWLGAFEELKKLTKSQ